MKKHVFSIFSFWRKYKILFYLNLTVILVLSTSLNLQGAGFVDGPDTQQLTVKGVVTDASSGEALPGVNVVVKGTTVGVITDAGGNYTLQLPDATARLQFSFIGYVTYEVAFTGQLTINVVLQSELTQLTEVVVVGYGTQKKVDLTGSVTRVGSDRLLDKPVFNVAQAIGGKIAGVKVIEASGAPGGAAMIRVRGTNSINSANTPLFVVDGIVGVANALTILNPNEIQSIDVLEGRIGNCNLWCQGRKRCYYHHNKAWFCR